MRVILILGIAALLAVGVQGANAAKGRYTRGDAEAMLNTYPPGTNIFDRLNGAAGLDIRPFPDFYGGISYCVEDWHVLAFLWNEAEYTVKEFGVVHTKDDALAFLRGLHAEFVLDGRSVKIVTTPIKPYLEPLADGWVEEALRAQYGPDATITIGKQWALQWGRVLAPADLPVGPHSLRVVVTDPGHTVQFDDTLQFAVSPSGSDACRLPR